MNGYRLNLGTFNECVEYISGCNAEYVIDPGTEIFYYMSHDGDIAYTDKAINSISVPIFDVGASISVGRLDDQDNVKMLMANIELDILFMLKRIIKESGSKFDSMLKNIKILVGPINLFDEDKFKGCYGWAGVGIAILKKSPINNKCEIQ